MTRLLLPDNHHAERRFAAHVLLEDFLGLAVSIEFGQHHQPTIELENGKRLIIEDHFFRLHQVEQSWLALENLPKHVFFQQKKSNPFLPEEDLPMLFGIDRLEVSEKAIICGVDVFASVFFMLTRWEEYVHPQRDHFGRFPAKAALAKRFGFLHRPVVDEMVEMLWNMLMQLGVTIKRKPRFFQALVTHDVDQLKLLPNAFSFLKKAGGDLLKRRNIAEFFFTLRSFSGTRFHGKNDPWDTFDFLMDISERNGLRSHFFFMSGGNTSFDNFFNIKSAHAQRLMKKIHERGHFIGFHPSFDAHANEALFRTELDLLRSLSPQPVEFGRQHFLRFEVPQTWQIWENCGMTWESTMSYPESTGFRCGTCHPFPVFNFLTRKKLQLLEIPLTVMDGTLAVYQKLAPQAMLDEILSLVNTVKRYKGSFVLLWHNSSFGSPDYEHYQWVYEPLIHELAAAYRPSTSL